MPAYVGGNGRHWRGHWVRSVCELDLPAVQRRALRFLNADQANILTLLLHQHFSRTVILDSGQNAYAHTRIRIR